MSGSKLFSEKFSPRFYPVNLYALQVSGAQEDFKVYIGGASCIIDDMYIADTSKAEEAFEVAMGLRSKLDDEETGHKQRSSFIEALKGYTTCHLRNKQPTHRKEKQMQKGKRRTVPQREREAVLRRYFAGESAKELAKEFGVSDGSIWSWAKQAKDAGKKTNDKSEPAAVITGGLPTKPVSPKLKPKKVEAVLFKCPHCGGPLEI
jgi:transposase-like protein